MASEYGRKNETSPLAAASYDYLAQLYEDYLNGKSDLPQFWCDYFTENKDNFFEVDYPEIRSRFKEYAQSNSQNPSNSTTITPAGNVRSLISAFRDFGHLTASISPLETNESECSLLDISAHDFKDSATNISEYGFYDKASTVGELVSLLEASYCSNASLETSHLSNVSERNWLYSQVEKVNPYAVADKDTKVKILENLTRAEGIEQYFAVKYVGQKRFSLEGGESVIPGLNIGLEYAVTEHNLSDVVIGMAHRGRLNVMLNTLGMATEEIFKEFEGRADYGNTSGDVKYHLGYSSDLDIADKSLHLTLMFNPSHLEFIAPVVNGSVRARQDLSVIEGKSRASVLPVIIHGDAAVAGQGVVAETFNMSKTPAFDVSGSLHIIINNQVGFTATSDDYMSSDYCSGIAKAVNAPIFHVNGDSPDAVVRCIQIAIDYRMKFGKDVVVDIVCYRRLGHNEADEPVATLPKMYQVIKNHPTIRVLYVNYLKEQGLVTDEEVLQLQNNVKEIMDDGLSLIAGKKNTKTQQRRLQWKKYKDKDWDQVVDTGINLVNLKKFAKQIVNIPEGLTMQRQVALMIKQRTKMGLGDLPLNWGMAELLAYYSLLDIGYKVRIVGQDSKRGTFSHRHTFLYDQETGEAYTPFHEYNDKGSFAVYDSVLSETAPLGFEYGYSITNPNCLNIWEAQFGDFANGAQVIIDQFISSGCQKWKRMSGLVLLLPHGYEGMGPEHSSARLERFLQLSAQNNMQVCVPTTPAQMFHLLLRQMMRDFRRPLIVLTPKSLLRHPEAISQLADLKKGRFEVVLPDHDNVKPAKVRRVVLCSGKVYYDLIARRRKLQDELESESSLNSSLSEIAIIRVEQLYPFPEDVLSLILSRYKKVKTFVWCQEEPQNQGAWFIIKSSIERCLQRGASLVYAGREFSAAPAAGYPSLHKKQQQDLVDQALGLALNSHEGNNDS